MRLERFLPAAVVSLMVLWAGRFTAAVISDSQLPDDMALGAIVAILLLVLLAAAMLVLLVWPLLRAMSEGEGEGEGNTAERGSQR